MAILDIIVFIVYIILILGIGFYFFNKNKNLKDYYIGGGEMSNIHVGLFLVAKDVGGGFSMFIGGTSTLLLTFFEVNIPFDFDPILIGISLSFSTYLLIKK